MTIEEMAYETAESELKEWSSKAKLFVGPDTHSQLTLSYMQEHVAIEWGITGSASKATAWPCGFRFHEDTPKWVVDCLWGMLTEVSRFVFRMSPNRRTDAIMNSHIECEVDRLLDALCEEAW